MADPGRPVTGYPAPNPPPTNGYPANQPPSGVSYPYGAHPPPQAGAGGYYNYQNYQPSYQNYDPNYAHRLILLRRVFAFAIGALLIFGTVSFIVWLVFRPQLPEFQVNSFSISNFSLGGSSLISFTSVIHLTATNPNKKMRLVYGDIQAGVFYRSATLSQTTVPPFEQDARNVTSATANFAAAGSFVDGWVVEGISNERRSNGNVNLNLRMLSGVSFRAGAWRRVRLVKVICLDLVVGLPSNVSSGALTAAPKPCRVGI